MNIKKAIFFLIAVINLNAETNSIEAVNRQLTGTDTKISSGGSEIKKPDTSGIYNYKEVVYEHIKLKQATAHAPQAATKMLMSEDIDDKRAKIIAERIAAMAKEKETTAKANALPEWPRFVEGYCYVKNEVEVEKIATYAYLSCDLTTPLGRGELVVSLVPDFYATALVAKPLYLNVIDKNRQKKRIPISSGAVLTQNKLSINIANVVNDRKIEKIIAAGTYKTLDTATKQAQLYLSDVRASRVKQANTTTTSIGGVTTTSATNTEKPVPSDYYLAGGLQVISELAKIIGDNVVNQLPYTFKVYKDTVLYVDLELESTEALRGFDPQINNIIKKQPIFDVQSGKETGDEPTMVPIKSTMKNNQNQGY